MARQSSGARPGDRFHSNIDECFIKHDWFCIRNDGFCILTDDLNANVKAPALDNLGIQIALHAEYAMVTTALGNDTINAEAHADRVVQVRH